MSQTPFEQAGSLRIGTVDFVSPDEIRVALDVEGARGRRPHHRNAETLSPCKQLPFDLRR